MNVEVTKTLTGLPHIKATGLEMGENFTGPRVFISVEWDEGAKAEAFTVLERVTAALIAYTVDE